MTGHLHCVVIDEGDVPVKDTSWSENDKNANGRLLDLQVCAISPGPSLSAATVIKLKQKDEKLQRHQGRLFSSYLPRECTNHTIIHKAQY